MLINSTPDLNSDDPVFHILKCKNGLGIRAKDLVAGLFINLFQCMTLDDYLNPLCLSLPVLNEINNS